MYALLLVLSVACTAVGVFAIGFGIPNHEFGLGNTLIVSGSVAIIGGIVTLGSRWRCASCVASPTQSGRARLLPRVASPSRKRRGASRRAPTAHSLSAASGYARPRPDMRPHRRSGTAMDAPEPPPMERPRPNILGRPRVGRASGR